MKFKVSYALFKNESKIDYRGKHCKFSEHNGLARSLAPLL